LTAEAEAQYEPEEARRPQPPPEPPQVKTEVYEENFDQKRLPEHQNQKRLPEHQNQKRLPEHQNQKRLPEHSQILSSPPQADPELPGEPGPAETPVTPQGPPVQAPAEVTTGFYLSKIKI
jgi:hypothetical protein